jgi:Rad3-related DNA helicase
MWNDMRDMEVENIEEEMLKKLKCEHGCQRLRAKNASIFVINMALFLTYAKHGVILKETDYVCIDEAHELSHWAVNAFEDVLPKPMNISETNDFLRRCGSTSILSTNKLESINFPSNDSIVFKANTLAQYLQSLKFRLDIINIRDVSKKTNNLMNLCKKIDKVLSDKEVDKEVESKLSLNAFMKKLKEVTPNESEEFDKFSEDIKKIDCNFKTERPKWIIMAKDSLEAQLNAFVSGSDQKEEILRLAQHLSNQQNMCSELCSSMNELKRFAGSVHTAKKSTNIAWTTEDEKLVIPLANKEGVKYIPSCEFIANKLDEFVWQQAKGVLLLSATMASSDHSYPENPFEIFCQEVGLDESTVASMRFPEVFDKSKIKICAPFIGKYESRDVKKKMEFINLQASAIEEHFRLMNKKKSVLIMAPSLFEIDKLHSILSRRLKGVEHIFFSNKVKFEQFLRTSEMRGVIYGSDGLSTGVNLPGRVGLVVITRPWNPVPDQAKQMYEKEYLGITLDRYWKYYRYRRDRKEFQAAGRLQRSNDDSGTILFLGEPMDNCQDYTSERLRQAWNMNDEIERCNKKQRL